MSKPSFLYAVGKRQYDASLPEDLHLTDILPKKILPILTRSCDKQTVICRQDFFRDMDEDAFCSHVTELLEALRALASERYHAAEAEKAEQGAGRFEQEVRSFRGMFDALVPGALVLLNEPFQSTAYDEGAKGLADILAYFSASDIRWILVSHMHQLKKHVRTDAVFLHTAKAYRIEQEK